MVSNGFATRQARRYFHRPAIYGGRFATGWVTVLVVGVVLAGTGCGLRPDPVTEPTVPPHLQHLWPGPDEPTTTRMDCRGVADPAVPGGAFVVTVTDSVRPAWAPVPGNPAERLVFAHLYETLITVDCQGLPHPGLASAWTCAEDSTVWTFTLRPDARFWDGTPVTAGDVRNAWIASWGAGGLKTQAGRDEGRSPLISQAAGSVTSPWAWLGTRPRSITVLDEQHLSIHLPVPQAGFPLMLAHPAAAVAVQRAGWTWPVGSGPCRLRASTPAPLPDLTCRPNSHHRQAPIWKTLTFLARPGVDNRDLVADQPDLLVVSKLQDVAFYDAAPGFRTEPLPWSRLYLLLCLPDHNQPDSERWLKAADRLSLPDDITGVATTPWPCLALPGTGVAETDPVSCPQLAGPVADRNAAPLDWQLADQQLDPYVLAFASDDAGARELAERLAALAGPQARVAPLAGRSLDFALQWQMPGACILALDQIYPGHCLQLATLLGQAAWLQDIALARPLPDTGESLVAAGRWDQHARGQSPVAAARALIDTGLVRPLALTRSYLVLRGELAGIRLDFDGTPLLDGLGRPATGGTLP